MSRSDKAKGGYRTGLTSELRVDKGMACAVDQLPIKSRSLLHRSCAVEERMRRLRSKSTEPPKSERALLSLRSALGRARSCREKDSSTHKKPVSHLQPCHESPSSSSHPSIRGKVGQQLLLQPTTTTTTTRAGRTAYTHRLASTCSVRTTLSGRQQSRGQNSSSFPNTLRVLVHPTLLHPKTDSQRRDS